MSSSHPPSKPRPSDPEFWTVENELPDPIPVSKAELDALERYFGDLLDAVFDPKPGAMPTTTIPIIQRQKGARR